LKDERQHLSAVEPRVKVVNLAGFVLQMPHPTRPLDIISEVRPIASGTLHVGLY
jgi:hypothetical protein